MALALFSVNMLNQRPLAPFDQSRDDFVPSGRGGIHLWWNMNPLKKENVPF